MRMINNLFNVEKFIKNQSNLRSNIFGIKQIVCQAKKIGIWSLFVSIQFEID